MSRHTNYITTGDRYSFLLDYSETVLRFTLFDDSEALSKLDFNTRGTYIRNLQPTGEKIRIYKNNNCCFVEVKLRFNFNRALFYHYKEVLEIARFNSYFKWQDNVLPSEMRFALEDRGIKIPEIRKKGYQLFFKHVEEVKTDLVQHLADLGISIQKRWLKWTLNAVEIDHDILTLPEIELAAEKQIRQKFNEAIDKLTKDCKFQNDGRTATIPDGSDQALTDTWRSIGDKEPLMLVGLYEFDKSIQRLYLKESGPRGSINRIERRFEGRACFCKYFDGNTIKDKDDFVTKINFLAAIAFEKHYAILHGNSHFSNKTKLKVLKAACRQHCGYKNWYAIYCILKKKGTIHTSGNGSVPGGVARKASEVHRKGILFRKKRVGVYVVDWNWLLSTNRQ